MGPGRAGPAVHGAGTVWRGRVAGGERGKEGREGEGGGAAAGGGAPSFFFSTRDPTLSLFFSSPLPLAQISAALLPRWDETALRIKASRLLGTQSLARYPGWKGGRAAVEAEAARNRAAGEAAGCWKGGVLVDDGSGRVAAACAALDAAAAAAAGGGE